MLTPTIHLNGTSRGDLHADYMNALIAVEEAIKMVRKTAPHGRDYYPQGNSVIIEAQGEHSARVRHLEAVKRELEELCLVTMP
jgi:hypothetical protein